MSQLDASKTEDESRMLEILREYGVRGKAAEFSSTSTMAGDAPKENKEGRRAPFQIVREHLPTPFLKSRKVGWDNENLFGELRYVNNY